MNINQTWDATVYKPFYGQNLRLKDVRIKFNSSSWYSVVHCHFRSYDAC